MAGEATAAEQEPKKRRLNLNQLARNIIEQTTTGSIKNKLTPCGRDDWPKLINRGLGPAVVPGSALRLDGRLLDNCE